MELSILCGYADLVCPDELTDRQVKGITSDSRKVKDGYVFVCIKGIHSDGHRYVQQALENGAIAVVAEERDVLKERVIYTKNSRISLSRMLDAFCGCPSEKMRFIGVTGTNGKTSVSVMLKHIFDHCGIPCGLIGTTGSFSTSGKIESPFADLLSNMTTPDPEELYPMLSEIADSGAKAVIMEVSSHSLALDKVVPINFDIGIFTNLTQDHLDFHKTMENYFDAKAKLFDRCKVGVINIDDAYGRRIASKASCSVKKCSLKDPSVDFSADEIKLLGENGVEYKIKTYADEFYVKCPVAGNFSVINSLEACSAALEYGLLPEEIKKAFETFCGVCGRFERVMLPKSIDFSVFIDYAHTPDALFNALRSARTVSNGKGRIILLFGCGGDRDKDKRPKMGRIASDNADKVIVTSDNSRSESRETIIGDILSGMLGKNNYKVIPDRREAIEYALRIAEKDDMVILAGKGHETYEITEGKRLPFDEREAVQTLWKKICGKEQKEERHDEN